MEALKLISTTVDLLQLFSSEYPKVAAIIAARIADGRKHWTNDEIVALDAAIRQVRDAAVHALP